MIHWTWLLVAFFCGEELMSDHNTLDPSLIVKGKQPNWTIESAVEYLQNCGWMQEHDKALTNQWIPVKERYPDKQGVYLVTVLNCTTMATYIIDGFGRSYFNILGVTAWMPLPEPYEEEQG